MRQLTAKAALVCSLSGQLSHKALSGAFAAVGRLRRWGVCGGGAFAAVCRVHIQQCPLQVVSLVDRELCIVGATTTKNGILKIIFIKQTN